MTRFRLTIATALLGFLALLGAGISPAVSQDGGSPSDPNRGIGDPGDPAEPSDDVGDNDQDSPFGVANDQVFLDDLIVDGSACVGQDCVNGESFGFDTIRLKENNLRLHFDDTSSTASFPDNDWRIVINDSSNGGGEYFAIEDSSFGRQVFRVNAGAPANSLFVSSVGNVGLGTSNPVLELHIVDGDTPTTRLEQNGSSGFTAQIWDIAGNEANFFVRDVTNGSLLPFKIKPGAPTDSLVIAADGQMTVKPPNPAGNVLASFQRTSGALAIQLKNTNENKFWNMTMAPSVGANCVGDTCDEYRISRNGGVGVVMTLRSDGTILLTGDVTIDGNLDITGSCEFGVGNTAC